MSPVPKGSLSGSSDENSTNASSNVNDPEGTSTVPESGTPAVSTTEGELHGATVPKDPYLTYEGSIDPNSAAPSVQSDDKSDDVETTEIDKGFVFTHNLDPARQIPGTSKYLDVEQRREAEIDRARVEDREPDLDNAPATQGTPYRSVDALNAELPPSANVAPDVVLPVVVTQEEADRQKSQDRSTSDTDKASV